LPSWGNIHSAASRPLHVANTSRLYGIVTGRVSPTFHSGKLTTCARGGGSLTSVARGAGGLFARICKFAR
jgi:hypothetical protein